MLHFFVVITGILYKLIPVNPPPSQERFQDQVRSISPWGGVS